VPDKESDIRQRIRALLAELHGGDQFASSLADAASLRQAGMSSNALVALLVAMEDEFGFEWDDDVRPEALRSIESLTGHVVSLSG
jgi:acyl carrier protein